MSKYRIEIEEIDDEDYREIKRIFTSYLCKIWIDDEYLGDVTLKGVNALFGLKSVLVVLKNRLFGEDE